MNATIVLDQAANVSYTNLDEISGRVHLRLTKAAEIANIVVKLEGESRSRLLSPEGPNGERPRPQVEYHKILYQLTIVFPPKDVLESRSASASTKAAYTVPVGQHEYPFTFKIPFNNSCSSTKSNMPNVSMSSMGLEISKPPANHVRKLLPPTLSGFPGEAEIRYFVKATVVRQSFFKENPRAYVPFNFFPLEEPRPSSSGSELYARQRHTFTPASGGEQTKAKMKSIFGLGEKGGKSSSPANGAPSLAIDARLPDPAILTCNEDVPLRIVVKNLNGSTDPVYLDSLQVSLIGFTKIRAHDVWRTESNSWVLVSKSNLGMQISNPSAAAESETVLDDRLWRGIPLPNTVAPTFQTCNIGRTYQLDVRIGLSYNGTSAAKPQNVVLPLRLDCPVYSGIAPSPELLERVARAKPTLDNRRTSSTAAAATSRPLDDKKRTSIAGGSNITNLPTSAEPQDEPPPIRPPRPATSSQADQQNSNEDAPPSYEDAIASDLPPMDAPRPDYAPPPPAEDDVLRRDEKRGWH